ncbi:MAG TPA: acetyl-CoA carboxylase biotin carboxylase subunit [Candidatus Acidoferrales bacterium]|nr:acetyl-CoA carboxylase biotin carboxylase subunit [Candidatus Acidoferrales bacterium]
MFKKVLIANRGEIAVRILRALREMGISAVAVYSDVDRAALHVRLVTEAYGIGPAPSRESYLAIEKIIEVAKSAGCDAIHPGYGFLAENAAFARACKAADIKFIGPSAQAMERLGSKTAARQLAREAGVPIVPGTLEPLASADEALTAANTAGFPIVLKAVAGGGGKGMRAVERKADLHTAFRDASSEALNAFGDGRLYLEKYLARPRHIEIQVLGDEHGNMVYLGERECSVQRRHQKVIEEAPSPIMTPELRSAMGNAAVKMARSGGYTNAGTMEFLVDADRKFYFLEMNTRLQVEHPVTELVTSLDLVKLQIRIAAGEKLPFGQKDVALNGHAIECRVYAEDPDNNFLPSPGTITHYHAAGGPGIRVDDGVYSGWTVPNEYDPMLGKVIAWGEDRSEAIARLRGAIAETSASGIKTNLGLFAKILKTDDFTCGEIYTRWLDDFLGRHDEPTVRLTTTSPLSHEEKAALIVAALRYETKQNTGTEMAANSRQIASKWKLDGRTDQVNRVPRGTR